MSGIGAIFHRDGRPVEREQLERMARSLSIYGPEKRVVKAEGEVGFVYTHFTNTPEARLGTQPLVSLGGRYTLLFDGRIDNREDLAGKLGLDRAALARTSDAALALANWERSAIEGLDDCVGEFAMIVWDREARALSLVRDHFGRRPLHCHVTGARVVAASMPKGIHALGDIPRELDRERLTYALAQVDADPVRSFFRGIDQVAPASTRIVTQHHDRSSRYYELRDHIRPIRLASDAEYVEAADHVFDQAMTACLRSPGKIGVQLSSGMDSSLVAAKAAARLAQRDERLASYTWVPAEDFNEPPPPGVLYDESPAAHMMAALYPNIDVNLIGREGPGISHGMQEFFLAAECVLRNSLNLALTMATGQRAREDQVKVLLNGGAGNFTLSYNGDGLPYDLFRRGRWRTLVREITHHRNPRHQWKRLALNIAPAWALGAYQAASQRRYTGEDRILERSSARREVVQGHRIASRAQTLGYDFGLNYGKNESEQQRVLLEHYAGPVEANLLGAMPALFGCEARDPFFDRRLIEWRFGVPETQFRRDGTPRYLMRRLMAGRVPEPIITQSLGKGMQSADWRERLAPDIAGMGAMIERAGELDCLAGIIDIERLRETIAGYPWNDAPLDSPAVIAGRIALPLAASVSAFALETAGVNYPVGE